MPSIRIDSREVVASGWSDVREAMPVAAGHATPHLSTDSPDGVVSSAARRWTRTAMRLARDAAIGLLLLISVPVAVVAVSRGSVWVNTADLRERIVDADRFRSLMAPTDESITPLQAGLAFHALQSPQQHEDVSERVIAGRGERPWQQYPLPSEAFAALRNPGYDGPAASKVVESALRGFSTDEMAYLRAVADAPLWSEFDKLARASRVDLVGGQFVLPFKDDVTSFRLPMRRFTDTKSLAYAGVSRAAYFLAAGQPHNAEAALRSVVSFGFVLIDNGTSAIDAMVGRVIVGIGVDGLHQLYVGTGNAEGIARTTPTPKSVKPAAAWPRTRVGMAGWQAQLLNEVGDAQLPRALRYESLRSLSFTTCGNVREMLFGPKTEVRDAFARAGTSLARYPSEQAIVELMYEAAARTPPEMTQNTATNQLVMGAAAVAGTVLNNPRIEACTRMALAFGQ